MRKLFIPATAFLLAVSATPAFAQDTLVSKGDVAVKPTFENLVAAMTNAKATNDELLKRQIINESEIIVVDSKPLIEGKGDDMLKGATNASRNASRWLTIHTETPNRSREPS